MRPKFFCGNAQFGLGRRREPEPAKRTGAGQDWTGSATLLTGLFSARSPADSSVRYGIQDLRHLLTDCSAPCLRQEDKIRFRSSNVGSRVRYSVHHCSPASWRARIRVSAVSKPLDRLYLIVSAATPLHLRTAFVGYDITASSIFRPNPKNW